MSLKPPLGLDSLNGHKLHEQQVSVSSSSSNGRARGLQFVDFLKVGSDRVDLVDHVFDAEDVLFLQLGGDQRVVSQRFALQNNEKHQKTGKKIVRLFLPVR